MSKSGSSSGQPLRRLPAVETLLEDAGLRDGIARYSRPLVTQAIQQVLARLREGIRSGENPPDGDAIVHLVREHLNQSWPGFMSPVVNATGVILHTNLGRAPLAPPALAALSTLAGGYTALEINLASGERGARIPELRRLVALLTGAEDALVVNNNAAAVLLVLVALAHGREAVVSRGELVQIGGGFRVPEIMEQSGVTLREAGTTNQTYARDYEKAISEKTAMLLKVHPSNFELRGFTHEATVAELAALGRKHGLPVVYDLGSGALLDSAAFGLKHEPTVQEALADGADLVCFSADKLLGGPQGGIIAGRKQYIEPLLKHPLLRVIRLDKLSALALEATLKPYLDKEAAAVIPAWRMMGLSADAVAARARKVARALGKLGVTAEVLPGESMVGGGSLPEQVLPTSLLAVRPPGSLEAFAKRLRFGNPPLLARTQKDVVLFDLRTVLEVQDALLAGLIKSAWTEDAGEIRNPKSEIRNKFE